jgi:hypothetical protein
MDWVPPGSRKLPPMHTPAAKFARITCVGPARLLAFVLAVGLPLCADVCNPASLQGPYGFQLSGDTTISGESKPVSNVGRMLLAADGTISGYSTVMFAGLLLGNPVTGIYEARWDCTVSWSLQDDSGAFQHFSGVATSDGKTVSFSQTDPGGAQNGRMARTPTQCKASDVRKQYQFTLSGATIPMLPGEAAGAVNAKGLIRADENSNFKLTLTGAAAAATAVTFAVDAQCVVDMQIEIPAPDAATVTPMTLRGVLVDDGKEILAIQTDAGAMVSASFIAP